MFQQMPLIMGVLNVTPDSFYDGGQYVTQDLAYQQAQNMIAAGADIIDIGGESSRPGADPISIDEELQRVIPVIERICATKPIAVSIDTYKPEIMLAAVKAGAACINDIFALQQPGALAAAAHCAVPVCLMHMQGTPQSMQHQPVYADVITEVDDFFEQRIQVCLEAGIGRDRLMIDPGFGFGKTTQHNLQLVKHLETFHRHGLPVLLGVSRKSSIGDVLHQQLSGRLIGGLALSMYAMLLGGVSVIRTHDVLETKQALQMIQHIILSDRGT